ncbi:BBP7 family outer membrane beta-barrel protein [Bremerella cremea]|uniref:BBP7 family outer membrane beta-barrel protein n=1 Tax=Bremerella cremea TaxID=1031537 RepID=UPI0031E94BEB
MKTFLIVPGALAGLLSASALFAQAPGNPYQPSAYRPGATYYAEPSAPAKLWSQPTQPVSYKPEAALEPVQGDKAYMDALEGKHQPAPSVMDSMGPASSPYSPSDCLTGDCNSGYPSLGAVYGDCCQPCSRWFAYGGALIMNRDLEKEVWLSYDTGDIGRQVMGSHDAGMDWSGGYEVRLGKYLGASNWAVEGVFWAVRDSTEFTVTNNEVTGSLNTVLEDAFHSLSYNNGGISNVSSYFNNALSHRLRRTSDFYNLELNLFQDPTLYSCNTGCTSFSVGVLGGIRYFRFSESMSYSADTIDYAYTGEVNEINYNVDVSNNLIGPQVGFIGNLSHGRWNVHLGSKLGIYGNIATQDSEMFGAAGYAFVNDPASPNDGREFNLSSSRGRVSFLGELDLGLDYKLFDCFTLSGGYRAVAVSGVALSADQIPQNFEDYAIINHVQASSDVILHGAYFGGQFVW